MEVKLLATLLAFIGVLASKPDALCANDGNTCYGSSALSLLQQRARKVEGAQGIFPVGRMFFSTNPLASAKFFIKYMNAKTVLPNITNHDICVQTAEVTLDDGRITLTFVKDILHGSMAPEAVKMAHVGFKTAFEKKSFASWEDFHDGYGMWMTSKAASLNVTRIIEERIKVLRLVVDDSMAGPFITRLHIPYTMQSVQFGGDPQRLPNAYPLGTWDQIKLHSAAYKDVCRHRVPRVGDGNQFWRKATFFAPRIASADNFVKKVFLGQRMSTRTPYPDNENCTQASWWSLPGSRFALHFAHSQYGLPVAGPQDVENHSQLQRKFRRGIFDPIMYNSIILWSNSLDPIIERLQRDSFDFLCYRLSHNVATLFVLVPDNGIVMQVRSAHVSLIVPRVFDPCQT